MTEVKARRGDLLVVETRSSYTTASYERVPMSFFDFGIVSSVTRDGIVKAWRTAAGGTRKARPDVRGQRYMIVGADKLDAPAALAALAEKHFTDYTDIAQVRDVLKPRLYSREGDK